MINQIFAFGSNFKQLNTSLRSKYTFDYYKLKSVSINFSINDYFLLNTCNRSEIYGIGNVSEIKEMIFNSVDVDKKDQKHFFAYQGYKAVEHIFSVVCGLNSQIIGDNEISGQFKNVLAPCIVGQIYKNKLGLNNFTAKWDKKEEPTAPKIAWQYCRKASERDKQQPAGSTI